MNLQAITSDDIFAMSYNELIGIVQETNRPPGGINSIIEIAVRSFLDSDNTVLEIGTSTGFTAIELARLTGAGITAIDINETSLSVAEERAKLLGVSDKIEFELQDAMLLPYSNEHYDLVFCGNVTSLLSNRDQALLEYTRVLKTGGILAAIPMYYIETPPIEILEQVRKAIQVEIVPSYKVDWVDFFHSSSLQSYWTQDYRFTIPSPTEIKTYVEAILERPHLQSLDSNAMATLEKTYTSFIKLFSENLSYMGYSIIMLRKEASFIDPELFGAQLV